ncbi:uncharacterized protein TRIADDRAFT_55813 [Trichoplax adhaerens]|uniref:Amine oxidase domain-containing protein n=1 Tax=Trichoplax adhaerens TaxID=10228 RepID=B3RVX7_TRIAD|nr:hypothetical protein TRIADDRAFT_55813 [Trichoplax adhaerens]EDV25573.1 hypothetical protein TRIADDRAFT_55813 [Trichoplax adhaerens]|eukprot:XP_002111606.1 hypothetical protein TRIADDRAFT_55813 [Trichoplax adhaerens]
MSPQSKTNKPLNVAVIGSGLAGISAAWFLTRCGHNVHLYERHKLLGLGAHSVQVGSVGDVVDVPARTFVAGYYPEMVALCREAGVQTHRIVAEPSFQVFGEKNYFAFRNFLIGAYALPFLKITDAIKNWKFTWNILYDMWRFRNESLRVQASELLKQKYLTVSVQEYLDQEGYSKEFGHNFLLPLFGVVATCSIQAVQNYPAAVVMEFLSKVLLTGKTYSKFTAGCRKVSEDLVKDVNAVYRDTTVEYVKPVVQKDGSVNEVAVKIKGQPRRIYDHVILSTQANQALKILVDATDDQKEVLSGFEYEYNECIVHTDSSLMPKDRKDWSPLSIYIKPDNYQEDDEKSKRTTIMFTMWQNTVQKFHDHNFTQDSDEKTIDYGDLFQTWNPWTQPDPATIVPGGRKQLERSTVTVQTPKYWEMVKKIQGQNNIWFCGAYTLPGVPLLENAVNSGLNVAEKLTNEVRPWRSGGYNPQIQQVSVPFKHNCITNLLMALLMLTIAYLVAIRMLE